MKINLVCGYCNKKFAKPKNEYNRRIKTGLTNFYCSRACAGIVNGGWKKVNEKLKKNGNLYDISKHANNRGVCKFESWVKRVTKRPSNGICNITADHLKEIWTGKCALTGVDIVLTSPSVKFNNPFKKASLDRIDANKGYEIGNVQWVCLPINFAKSNYSQEQVKNWINEIKSVH
jgi:hypothetical protein